MKLFSYQPTRLFDKRLKKIKGGDPEGYKRLMETVERLLVNPEEADGKMTGPHRGRLKKYVGRSGYRIIYNWCSTCRKANHHLTNSCEHCDIIADDSVVFHDVFSKHEAQRLGY